MNIFETQPFDNLISPLISVIVCTFNRSELLTGALQTLCEQTLEASNYEIIVVDNNSSDNTRAVTEEFRNQYPNIRYHLEMQQGLSYARNRGWKEAQGEYVAYIDDDCRVPNEWLAVAKDIIERESPGVFGGPFYPFYNSAKPNWYKDSYGSHEPFKVTRVLKDKECFNIYGGNMFFRRNVLRNTNGFNPRFGMSGKKIAYSEETILLREISESMPEEKMYYDPKLYLYHLVSSKKMTFSYNLRSFFIHGRFSYYYSDLVLSGQDDLQLPGRRQLLKKFVTTARALAVTLVRSVFPRDQSRYPYIQNYLYERTYQHFYTLGKLYEQYCQIKQHH